MLRSNNIDGSFFIEKGEPVSQVIKLIKKQKTDILICSYEHSIFGNTFFEQIRKQTKLPIVVL